jgi:hypothetical protein
MRLALLYFHLLHYETTGANMKRVIAAIVLAGASSLPHAQWIGQAKTAETYTWGAPVSQKPVRHTRPVYVNPFPTSVNPPSTYVIPPPVPQGAIDVRSGQYYPPAAGGITNPQSGQFYPSVAGGYVNPQNGQFMPSIP